MHPYIHALDSEFIKISRPMKTLQPLEHLQPLKDNTKALYVSITQRIEKPPSFRGEAGASI